MADAPPLTVPPDAMRVAHMGAAGNCQTDRNADGTWPATCTCGERTIEIAVPGQ